MKVTDKRIAEEFGVTTQTLRNWKNGSIKKIKLYNVLKDALYERFIIWKITLVDGSIEYVSNNKINSYTLGNIKDIEKVEILTDD